jgi:hypothetical protein
VNPICFSSENLLWIPEVEFTPRFEFFIRNILLVYYLFVALYIHVRHEFKYMSTMSCKPHSNKAENPYLNPSYLEVTFFSFMETVSILPYSSRHEIKNFDLHFAHLFI